MENIKSVSVSELRENLKEILEDVKSGCSIQITQRGTIIAVIQAQNSDKEEKLFLERMKSYKKGSIQIVDNIVNQPLKQYDFHDELIDFPLSIASDLNEKK